MSRYHDGKVSDWMLDALMLLAEKRILEAMENGEFQNLPGQGKPQQYDELKNVPNDLRMSYKILKNSGVLPQEMNIKREIVSLEKMIKMCRSENEQQALKEKLLEKTLYYNILMEKRRK